jgi:hypothetical protein
MNKAVDLFNTGAGKALLGVALGSTLAYTNFGMTSWRHIIITCVYECIVIFAAVYFGDLLRTNGRKVLFFALVALPGIFTLLMSMDAVLLNGRHLKYFARIQQFLNI